MDFESSSYSLSHFSSSFPSHDQVWELLFNVRCDIFTFLISKKINFSVANFLLYLYETSSQGWLKNQFYPSM